MEENKIPDHGLIPKGQREKVLNLSRNSGLGLVAVNISIIIQMLQVDTNNISLQIFITISAVSIVISVSYAAANEFYILFGERSFGHVDITGLPISFLMTIASVLTSISVGSLLFKLSPFAAGAFTVAVSFFLAASFSFMSNFSDWWEKQPSQPQNKSKAQGAP